MRSSRGFRSFLLLGGLVPCLADEPRLNDFQVIGTHNSYHVEPGAVEMALIRKKGEAEARSLEYSHRSLKEQLEMGVRQFELDLFADPDGGHFAIPLAMTLGPALGLGRPAPHDPTGKLAAPGTKVLHFPGFDFRTTVLTLHEALGEMIEWSEKHPDHFPVMVLLELKGTDSSWGDVGLKALEKEILTVMERGRLLTPDDVRQKRKDLRTAVMADGWPELRKCRGKFLLALDNEGDIRDGYLEADPVLTERLFFPSCRSAKDPAAGWFKVNDPERGFARIRELVEAGFMVRTRADADLIQGRRNDTTRRDKAFATGAQFVSTDFPEVREEIGDGRYRVVFPGEKYLRPNPVTGE